jgi:TPP-dependent pyruvate/acetoin dehydrogenase alpha subunit
MRISSRKKLEIYNQMLLIRKIEERIAEEYHNNEMRCPVHLSIGQEACAVGACIELKTKDVLYSTHRSHAHYIAKKCDLKSMISEIYGKETGCCGGRGGSMHLIDTKKSMYGSIPIVGSSIALALGSAYYQKINNKNNITVVFIGDASIEEGIFHESANFASLHNLPLVFICENNLYSVYTNINERQPHSNLIKHAEAHNIKSKHIDGNDVLKVYEEINNSRKKCLKNEGPFFFQLDTYRWREHCGPNYDNDLGYRSEKEFNLWKSKCPLKKFRKKLVKEKILNDVKEKKINNYIDKKIEKVFEFAKKSNLPNYKKAERFVYAK